MSKIQRAILSVTDKSGLVDFARKLAAFGVELISTGGTAKLLRDSGIAVKDISELTGFPEMLDGRVKTLHPKVHGGILYRRADSGHLAAVAEHGIAAIDMVVVNLYAFEKTAAKPGVRFEELIENIDIGGPSMIRSAAKNFQDVAVVTSPSDYGAIAGRVRAARCPAKRNGGWRRRRLRRRPLTIPPSPRRLSGWAPAAFRKLCGCLFKKWQTCAMERIRTRRLRCTRTVRA